MEFRKLIGFSCLLGPQVCQDNGAPVKWTNSCIMVFGAIYTIRDLRKTYKQFKVPEAMKKYSRRTRLSYRLVPVHVLCPRCHILPITYAICRAMGGSTGRTLQTLPRGVKRAAKIHSHPSGGPGRFPTNGSPVTNDDCMRRCGGRSAAPYSK